MRKSLMNGQPWKVGDGIMTSLTCCDCGLVHRLSVDVNKGKSVTLAFYRDDYATIKKREKRGIRIAKKKNK